MRLAWAVALTVCALVARPAIAAPPSNEEQYMLELINRFRMDPKGELDRLTNYVTPGTGTVFATPPANDPNIASALQFFQVDANLLRQQFNALTPVAPLNWNPNLNDAAAAHNALMIQNQSQSHQLPGEPALGTRINNAGYTGWQFAAENVYGYSAGTLYGHAGFAIDWGDNSQGAVGGIQNPPGHRNNLLDSRLTEVGVSLTNHTPDPNNPNDLGPQVITEDFGGGRPVYKYLTGVIYQDNPTHFYAPGTGLGGLTITVKTAGTSTVVASGTTYGSGGYDLPLPAGTYDITVSDSSGHTLFSQSNYLFTSGANQKLDFVQPVPEPATAGLIATLGLLAVAWYRRRAVTVV